MFGYLTSFNQAGKGIALFKSTPNVLLEPGMVEFNTNLCACPSINYINTLSSALGATLRRHNIFSPYPNDHKRIWRNLTNQEPVIGTLPNALPPKPNCDHLNVLTLDEQLRRNA